MSTTSSPRTTKTKSQALPPEQSQEELWANRTGESGPDLGSSGLTSAPVFAALFDGKGAASRGKKKAPVRPPSKAASETSGRAGTPDPVATQLADLIKTVSKLTLAVSAGIAQAKADAAARDEAAVRSAETINRLATHLERVEARLKLLESATTAGMKAGAMLAERAVAQGVPMDLPQTVVDEMASSRFQEEAPPRVSLSAPSAPPPSATAAVAASAPKAKKTAPKKRAPVVLEAPAPSPTVAGPAKRRGLARPKRAQSP